MATLESTAAGAEHANAPATPACDPGAAVSPKVPAVERFYLKLAALQGIAPTRVPHMDASVLGKPLDDLRGVLQEAAAAFAGSRDHTPASPDVISPPSTRRSLSEGASAATPIETLYDTPVLPGDLVNGAVYVYAPFTCTARLLASPSRPSPPRRKAGPMPTVKLLWYAARARRPARVCVRAPNPARLPVPAAAHGGGAAHTGLA